MSFFNQELMYEFQARDLAHRESVKQYADHIVKEIKSRAGWDADVQLRIEREGGEDRPFNVSMSVWGIGEAIRVSKEAKNVMAALRKIRKVVLRQAEQVTKRGST